MKVAFNISDMKGHYWITTSALETAWYKRSKTFGTRQLNFTTAVRI